MVHRTVRRITKIFNSPHARGYHDMWQYRRCFVHLLKSPNVCRTTFGRLLQSGRRRRRSAKPRRARLEHHMATRLLGGRAERRGGIIVRIIIL